MGVNFLSFLPSYSGASVVVVVAEHVGYVPDQFPVVPSHVRVGFPSSEYEEWQIKYT